MKARETRVTAQDVSIPGHTPGPWTMHPGEDLIFDDVAPGRINIKSREGWSIARVWEGEYRNPGCANTITQEHVNANARLIAEAGTVATETGRTPRQLADDRKALLEALEACLKWMGAQENGTCTLVFDMGVDALRRAIGGAASAHTHPATPPANRFGDEALELLRRGDECGVFDDAPEFAEDVRAMLLRAGKVGAA